MVLKLVLLPIHSFWRRKSYMVLKPDFFDVPMNFQLGRVIAGFSNKHSAWLRWPYGLEGNRIAGYSNGSADVLTMFCGLEEDKIAGFSNSWADGSNPEGVGCGRNYRVLKRCTISLLSRHLGLEESKITGHSNKREKIARLSKRVPKGSKLKTRITNA